MLPLFKSHYSIGKSILTLDDPKKVTENGADSIFKIVKDNSLKKIVLVDDHVLLRNGLSVIIGGFDDFTILFEANHGQHFIEKLDPENLPDIVLLDVTMPVMNGFETAEWIFTHHPSIKVMVLSMLGDERTIIKMLKMGAFALLIPPADFTTHLHRLTERSTYLFSPILHLLI